MDVTEVFKRDWVVSSDNIVHYKYIIRMRQHFLTIVLRRQYQIALVFFKNVPDFSGS